MAITIKQDCDYKDDDWWDWSVWIEGSDKEMDNIKSVEYTLHSTFPSPVRKITDRASNFRLTTTGWGNFTLYAKVLHTDGSHTLLEHDVILYYPDGTATSA